jgi:hypothetical protein
VVVARAARISRATAGHTLAASDDLGRRSVVGKSFPHGCMPECGLVPLRAAVAAHRPFP